MEHSKKARILDGVLVAFRKKGVKFTMDDVAYETGMSKKTIYKIFPDKNRIILDMVDRGFDAVKESERKLIEDPDLGIVEKIRGVMGVLPEGYQDIEFQQFYLMKDKYPLVYQQIERRLESGWEGTIELLEQGMKEGKIKKVQIPIVKVMLEASLEQFFQRDVLQKNQIPYLEALNQVVDIIVDGITETEGGAHEVESK